MSAKHKIATKPAIATAMPSSERIDFEFLKILDFTIETKGLQQRSKETWARIVAVACEAFMSRGYAGVSTHDVSAAAGVTQGLITYHFKSKEGLWQAAMDRVFGEFRNNLSASLLSLRNSSEREFIERFIRQMVSLEMKFPFIIRFMVENSKVADSHIIWLIERHIKPIYDVIFHIFEVSQRHGAMRPLPIANAYYVLLTAGTIFSLKDEIRIVAGQDTESKAFSEEHADCLIQMLLTDVVA